MPVELQVIHANDFVRLDPHEHLDFAASKKALQDLAHACQKRGLRSAVVDLRELPVPAKPLFTKNELASLVLTFRDAGFTRAQRLAVLYRHDVYGGIRDFAFFSRMRGMKVQAFEDFEVALQWLSEGQECRDEPGQAETPVPITKRVREAKKLEVGQTAEGLRAGASRPVRGKANQQDEKNDKTN